MAQDKNYPGIVDLVSSTEGHWHYHITESYLVIMLTDKGSPNQLCRQNPITLSFSKFPILTFQKKVGEFP